MPSYPTYKLAEIITDAIGGDWGKDPGFQDDSYELAYCIRGAEYKNWASEKGATAALRKIKSTNLLKRQLKEGDIIVEISGGGPEQPVGRTEVITKDVLDNFKGKKVICTNFLRLIRPNINVVDSVFLNHYLKFFYSTGEIIKYQAGSNNLRNLKFNDYLTLPIPLPPLPTQHQIVSRIESLFAELDKAVEHLRTAQQQLKIYRQAVLNHWLNNENGKWETVKLGDVAEKIFDGPFGTHLKSDDYVGEGIRVVRLENIKAGFFDDSKQSFVTEEKYETIKRHTVYPSDLIMSTFIAEEVKVCQMPEYIGFAVNKADCIGIRLKPEISVDYIKYYLSLRSVYHELEIQVHGATRPRVNTTQIKNIKISLPPLSDQQRIVDEIETRLSQAEAAEVRIAESLQKTEALRQSILKKAFSGELV